MSKATGVDIITKVLIVVTVTVFIFIIVVIVLNSFFVHQPDSWQDMMNHMMSFDQQSVTMNLIALSLALAVGTIVSVFLSSRPVRAREREKSLKIPCGLG